MNLDLTERVRKLELQVAHLLRQVNKPVMKARLKPKTYARRRAPADKADAIRDWMRRAVVMRDEDLHKAHVFINAEGRRFVDFTYFCQKYMRTKSAFRDGQVLLTTSVLRTTVRNICESMDLLVIDYPKRVGLTTLKAVLEIPAYGHHVGPDHFPSCMSVSEIPDTRPEPPTDK